VKEQSLVRGGRIATIDGLRAIAIAAVLYFHYWQITWQWQFVIPVVHWSPEPIAETGFLGVALFFFISGFVLMLPYAQAHFAGTAPPTIRHFASRRLLKIVPSYILVSVVMIAVGYQTYTNFGDEFRDIAFHLLFIHNWFAATANSINGVMWSLAVEVQFYVLFPLLVLVFVRRPLWTTLGLFAVANGYRVWVLLSNHYFSRQRIEQLPAYIDFFAAGMLAAYTYVWIASRHPDFARRSWFFTGLSVAGFIGLWYLVADCSVHRSDNEWPLLWVVEWRSVLAVACFAIGLGSLFAVTFYQRILANRVSLFIAAISYNLYLWHQVLARGLVKMHWPPWVGADPHNDPHWQALFWFVAIPVSLAVSALITYGFEQPILRLGKRRPETRPSVVPIAPETLAET
jgi:peptidoglycan/LPS O-acetylase OafA/YrhL